MSFTARPFNAVSLRSRLKPIWARQELPPEVTVEALRAIKLLSRSQSLSVPSDLAGLTDTPRAAEMLAQAYSQPSFTANLRFHAMHQAVFCESPQPAFNQNFQLLDHAQPDAFWIALRTALRRKQFLDAFKIVDKYSDAMKLPIYPFVSLLLAAPWIPSPISAVIFTCWLGLSTVGIYPANSDRVGWKPTVSMTYRLRNKTKLRMVNCLLSWYEDLTGVTIDNYHRSHSRAADDKQSRLIYLAIHQRGFDILPSRDAPVYGEYWANGGGAQFTWEEPDQDPLDFMEQPKAIGRKFDSKSPK